MDPIEPAVESEHRAHARMVAAICEVDNRPPASAEALVARWLDGVPVHASWPVRVRAMAESLRAGAT